MQPPQRGKVVIRNKGKQKRAIKALNYCASVVPADFFVTFVIAAPP